MIDHLKSLAANRRPEAAAAVVPPERPCDVFNQVGKLPKECGRRFYYHNHYQEFQEFGDDFVYDLILKNTDPELVKLELDTYCSRAEK